jgi:ABC-type metal ion transport system substrate-binding protein
MEIKELLQKEGMITLEKHTNYALARERDIFEYGY